MAAKNKEPTYVKIDNANLNKLTIRRMSMLYTDYGRLIIQINKLHTDKEALKSKVYKDIVSLWDKFKKLHDALPSDVQREIIMPKVKKNEIPAEEKEFGLESFETLKKEFERIKVQLESIK
jgi:hypothetical protein